MNSIDVQLFGVLRERLGSSVVSVPVDLPATGAEVLDRLAERHPELADFRNIVRLAVNHTYVDEGVREQPGDEVALITPVSGG